MKIIFVTNIVVFHQIPIWDSFVKKMKMHDEFIYLFSNDLGEHRKKMFYETFDRSYITNSTSLSKNKLNEMFSNCDIVIYSCTRDKRITDYVKKAKHVIFMTEHTIKKRSLKSFLVLCLVMFFRKFKFPKDKYLLANSSHCFKEFKMFGLCKNKMFRFGYFPSLPRVNKNNVRNRYQVIFSGRMVKFKKPMLAIDIFSKFVEHNNNYKLLIYGEGDLLSKTQNYVRKKRLNNNVIFSSFLNHDELIKKMSESTFALFTSGIGEGYGVVLQEYLSQGCVCFANSDAGSTNFLINKNNGFKFGSKKEAYDSVKEAMRFSEETLQKISSHSIESINSKWNARVAGERVYDLCYSISNEKELPHFKDGPVSEVF